MQLVGIFMWLTPCLFFK